MSFIIIDIEPDSPEHFEFRKGKIGASHAPDIMGVGFHSPLQLWEELSFDRPRRKTASMQRGNDLEKEARAWVNAKLKVDYQPKIIQSMEHPWRIASLDGYYKREGKHYLLEIKCPGHQDHLQAVGGNVPEKYNPQLQHQMDLADVDHMFYCSFDGEEAALVVVERDKAYCKELLREETVFKWRLDKFVAPEPSDKDWMEIKDSEAVLKAERLRELKLLIDELEEEETDLKSDLEAALKHSRCKIGNMKVKRVTKVGNFDYKKIEEETGIDLEKYRKSPVTYWSWT